MNIELYKPVFKPEINIPSSKSELHRLIICAFLSDKPTDIIFNGDISDDIEATLFCIKALGGDFYSAHGKITVYPPKHFSEKAVLDCRSSGTTLRFFLCICAALNIKTKLVFSDDLANRPLTPLLEALKQNGGKFYVQKNCIDILSGLASYDFIVRGDISSQFVSGLLFACAIYGGRLTLSTPLQSADYVKMTENFLSRFACKVTKTDNIYEALPSFPFCSNGGYTAGGDWSNAAFLLIGGIVGSTPVKIKGLENSSLQGDREIINILSKVGARFIIEKNSVTALPSKLKGFEADGKNIPDIVMPLAIAALTADSETLIYNTQRLKYKETDRIISLIQLIKSLGGKAEYIDGTLHIYPSRLTGGKINGYCDHRTVMAGTLAAVIAEGSVSITDCEAVRKSYPTFFDTLIF